MRYLRYVLLLALAGCHSYAPVGDEPVPAGTEIRARIEVDRPGQGDGPATEPIDGTLVRADADTVALSVWRPDPTRERRFGPVRDTVAIPRDQIAVLQERRFSYLKTGLLAGGMGVGFYALVTMIIRDAGGTDGSPQEPGDGGTEFLRVPIGIRLPR